MRKALVVGILGLLGIGLVAAPALAQRDPFDPPIDAGSTPPPVNGEPEPVEPEPEPEPEPQPEDLADTGFAAQPFVVLAYALVAVGTAAVAIGGVARRQD